MFPQELLSIVPQKTGFAVATAEQVIADSFDKMRRGQRKRCTYQEQKDSSLCGRCFQAGHGSGAGTG